MAAGSTLTTTFSRLSPQLPLADQHRPHVLEGTLEAGGPHLAWVLGGVTAARATIGGWLDRPNSELHISRVTLRLVGDSPVGGFVAVPGGDLAACRRADTVALLSATDRAGRVALTARLREGDVLFPPAQPDQLYLSKVWAPRPAQGFGHGLPLLREFMRQGRDGGFARLRADVMTDNVALQRFGEFLGWRVGPAATSGVTGLSYVMMTWDGQGRPRRRRP